VQAAVISNQRCSREQARRTGLPLSYLVSSCMAAVDSAFPSRWFVSHISLVIDDYGAFGVFGVDFGIRITRCKDDD
jgi:hypothetical protein